MTEVSIEEQALTVEEPVYTIDEQLQQAAKDIQMAAQDFYAAGQARNAAAKAHDCLEAQLFMRHKSERRDDGKPRTDAECHAMTLFALGSVHDEYEASKINYEVAKTILASYMALLSALQTRAKMTTQTDAAIANSPY